VNRDAETLAHNLLRSGRKRKDWVEDASEKPVGGDYAWNRIAPVGELIAYPYDRRGRWKLSLLQRGEENGAWKTTDEPDQNQLKTCCGQWFQGGRTARAARGSLEGIEQNDGKTKKRSREHRVTPYDREAWNFRKRPAGVKEHEEAIGTKGAKCRTPSSRLRPERDKRLETCY